MFSFINNNLRNNLNNINCNHTYTNLTIGCNTGFITKYINDNYLVQTPNIFLNMIKSSIEIFILHANNREHK